MRQALCVLLRPTLLPAFPILHLPGAFLPLAPTLHIHGTLCWGRSICYCHHGTLPGVPCPAAAPPGASTSIFSPPGPPQEACFAYAFRACRSFAVAVVDSTATGTLASFFSASVVNGAGYAYAAGLAWHVADSAGGRRVPSSAMSAVGWKASDKK